MHIDPPVPSHYPPSENSDPMPPAAAAGTLSVSAMTSLLACRRWMFIAGAGLMILVAGTEAVWVAGFLIEGRGREIAHPLLHTVALVAAAIGAALSLVPWPALRRSASALERLRRNGSETHLETALLEHCRFWRRLALVVPVIFFLALLWVGLAAVTFDWGFPD